MIRAAALAAVVMLAGCGSQSMQRPKDEKIDRLENAAARVRCLSPLERWERNYFWVASKEMQFRSGRFNVPDGSQVGFYYRDAKASDLEPRRIVHLRVPRRLAKDQRLGVLMAYGTYDVIRDELSLRYCGPSRA